MMAEVGPIANPRLCIVAHNDTMKYKWQILFKTISEENYSFEGVRMYLEQLRYSSGYTLCPGLKEYPSEVHFKTKNFREWGVPFGRMDSKYCLLWHIPNNIHHPAGDLLRDTCAPCRRISYDIKQLTDQSKSTEGHKLSRLTTTSNYPLKYLSPSSKASRISRLTKERKNLSAKVSALAPFDCNVKDKQHAELLQFVKSVHKNGAKTIEQLCAKGDKILGQDNNLLREAWRQDVVERLEFEQDQFNSGLCIWVWLLLNF